MSASWAQMAAGKHPDRVAIEDGPRSITYSELSRKAGARAQSLKAHDPVALELEDRFEFALNLHACLVAHSPALPIDQRLTAEERAARRMAGSASAEVATIMHTSGTTSRPKPVELTYENWLHSSLASAVALGLDLEERWLCVMPLTHVGGLSILIRSAIYATTVVLHEGFDTDAVLAELMDPERRITMVSLVPTTLTRLLDAGLERPPTLRWALLGGGAISASLLQRAAEAGVPVAPTYGMTEACSQIATFGVPLPGVDLMLSEQEILVRGPIVAPGAVDERGWLHTGDLGRFDEYGRLEVIGRKSETIITGGENVSPQEVEEVLLMHPAVSDAAVIGRSHPEWGEAVVALVVLRDREAPDPSVLNEHCRQHLAAFKVPKAIEMVEDLPRTASGKLLRRELR